MTSLLKLDLVGNYGDSICHRNCTTNSLRTHLHFIPISLQQGMALGVLQVRCHHFLAHLVCGNFGYSAQLLLGLGGVAQQGVYPDGAEVPRVDAHYGLPGL